MCSPAGIASSIGSKERLREGCFPLYGGASKIHHLEQT